MLSDTSDLAHAAIESRHFAELANAWRGRIALTYRRREVNTGFKAGNIRDFCDRWGDQHDFALVLDADSLMTADAVLRLVRIMQANPQLGILQSLVIGMPSTSAFARIFQFGMRLGMRSYTIGSAWWQGDCGPYWGHNALVRIAPFMTHCHLPVLGKGALIAGHVLSHDQVEAVLMRRAGYEVRVLPEEGASFEQNPPTLIEFIRRDLRWCQGNMQYWHFLVMPGLKSVSRYQLAFALLMFLGSPGWIGLLVFGSIAVAFAGSGAGLHPSRRRPGCCSAIVLVMWFAPKIATVIDVLTRPALRRSFRRRLPLRRGRGYGDDLLPAAGADHVVRAHPVPRAAADGPLGRLGRAGARRPLACRGRWRRGSYGRTRCWALSTVGLLALHRTGGHPLRAVRRRRSAAVDPARGRHRVARARACHGPDRARPSAGGNRAATGDGGARPARGRARSRTPRVTLARTVADAARRRPLAAHLLWPRAHDAATMDRLYRQFVQPGDLVFDVGAHVGDRDRVVPAARRPRGRGRAAAGAGAHAASSSTAATAPSRSNRRRSDATPGSIDLKVNPRQSDGVERLRCVHQGGRRRAGLGRSALDQDRARAGRPRSTS